MFRLVAMMVGTLCRKLGRPSDRLVEIDPNIFRVHRVDPHSESRALLHERSEDCRVVRWTSRYFHSQSQPAQSPLNNLEPQKLGLQRGKRGSRYNLRSSAQGGTFKLPGSAHALIADKEKDPRTD